jgi:glycerol-3-phosphate dehydrogenase
VVARDLQDNRELAVASRLVVNAAGPWLGRLPGDGSALSHQLWATAVNLVVKKKLFHHYAVGLEGYTEFTDKDALIKRGKRLFFFVPWQSDYTMIGTTYTPYRGSSDDFALTRDDLGKILWDINQIYPQGKLVPADVSFFHGGLLPITEADDRVADSVQLDKSSTIIDHGPIDGREGLLSIKGVKYTTAPSIARKVVRLLNGDRWLGRPPAPVYQVPRPGMVDFGRVIARLGSAYADLRRLLSERYGAAWREVFALVAEQMAESEGATFPPTVSEQPLLLVAEVRYFLREEMAATVADVVFRRSNLAAAECPPRPVLARIAAIVGRERGLTDDELARQVTEVEAVFAILQPQENNSVS